MENGKNFIIDFDSTFVKIESLDLLASIALNGRPDQEERVSKISSITDQGMNGDISFSESLSSRLALLDAHQNLSLIHI